MSGEERGKIEKLYLDITACRNEFERVHSSYQCIYTKLGIVMAVVCTLFIHTVTIKSIDCQCFMFFRFLSGFMYVCAFIWLLILALPQELKCPNPWEISCNNDHITADYYQKVFDDYKECLDRVIEKFTQKQNRYKYILKLTFLGFVFHIILICCCEYEDGGIMWFMGFIRSLNENSGAMMVIITLVYVIATIFICLANQKSAAASLKQIDEMRTEFEKANRAFVTVDLVVICSGLLTLKIQNNGKRPAKKVNVSICEEFLANLKNTRCADELKTLSKSYFSLGIGQSRHVMICGTGEVVENIPKMLIVLTYQDGKDNYKENLDIDMSQHFWELIYESPLEDMRKEIKGINESVKYIKDDFRKVVNKQN